MAKKIPDPGFLTFKKIFDTVAPAVIVAVVLASGGWLVNHLTTGGLISALGGISASQITSGRIIEAHVRCGDAPYEAEAGPVGKRLCTLIDLSFEDAPSPGGWKVCRFDEKDGKIFLTADMSGAVCGTGVKPLGHVYCKARCLEF